MLLLLFAALGYVAGNRLGITARGFVAIAAVSIGASVLQVVHLLTASDRTWMTLLPMVVGTLIVAGMLIGAVTRSFFQPKTAS